VIRGYALVLGLVVVAAAVFVGWASTTRVVYFPPALFDRSIDCGPGFGRPMPVLDPAEADAYGAALRGLGEPSLYAASLKPDAGRSLRFTWLRSFDDPIVVRIDRSIDGRAQLTARQRGQGRPDSLTRQVSRRLTRQEVRQLDRVVASAGLPDQAPVACMRGADGARWIMEAVEPSAGHVYVNRWSPREGPVRDLGLHMLGLTGWEIAEVY
jgi:hypothetical protein